MRCQDGWILAKFFFCMFMDRDGSLVNKGFIIWLSTTFFLQDVAGNPVQAR